MTVLASSGFLIFIFVIICLFTFIGFLTRKRRGSGNNTDNFSSTGLPYSGTDTSLSDSHNSDSFDGYGGGDGGGGGATGDWSDGGSSDSSDGGGGDSD